MSRSLKIVHEVTKQDASNVYNLIPDDNTSWTNVTGAVTTSLGKVVPTTTATGFNKGASFDSLPAYQDGYVEFRPCYMAGQTTGGRAMAGLSDNPSNADFTQINYAIFFVQDGTIQIFEKGAGRGIFTTYISGVDVFRIERTGTIVEYKKNGTTFYTSSVVSAQELSFDISIDEKIGVDSARIYYDEPCTETLIPGLDTAWVTNIGSFNTSVGTALPAINSSSWATVIHFDSIPSGTAGFIDFKFDNSISASGNGPIMAGLSTVNNSVGYQTITYPFYYEESTNKISVYNSFTIQRENPATDFNINDVFRISRDSLGVIRFFRNGNLFYTSTHNTTDELYFELATYSAIGVNSVSLTRDTLCPIYTVTQTDEFDLLEDEYINIQKSGINIDALGDIEAGTTNSFTIPYTANNNKIFDYLELVGTQSNFPYQDNFVKYTEDGIELITNGRLKVTELSNKGYEVDILHGVNDFFDKIRGKFLYEAYEPYRTTLQQMVASQTTLCNNTTVRDNEGYCVPLIDLAGINPIAEYQQTVGYYLKFGIEKIAEAIDYTVSYDNIDLEDYVFTHNELPTFDTRTNNFINDQIISPSRVILKDEGVTTYQFTMRDTGVLYLNQILVMTSTASGYTTPPEYDFEILLNNTTSLYNNTITSMGTFTDTFTSATALPKGSVITFEITTSSFGATDGMTLDFYFYAGLYSTNGDVYHENILGDYSQTDFLKNIMQTFNIGVTVSAIAKTINFYNANDVFKITGAMNDLTRYYSETKSRSFDNDYGRNNIFKYKYLADDADFADGVLVANNTNEEKTIIDSELTASEAFTPMTLGQVNTKLITVKGYDSQTPNAKNNAIGYRISKVTRVNTTPSHPVVVDYENTSNVTTTYTSDQTFLNFGGLDWSTIINTRYNNLRDNVLNRYVKYTVLMNCPKHIINDYDFKEQVYIRDLGSRFAVSKISTLTNGMSEWELIKIN